MGSQRVLKGDFGGFGGGMASFCGLYCGLHSYLYLVSETRELGQIQRIAGMLYLVNIR